jgi:hypothetical protein
MTPNTIHFPTGPNGTEVLRLSKDGIWANPDIPADDAAKLVLTMLDNSIKSLVQKAVEKEREACAELCEMLDVANPKGKSWDEGTIDCATAIRARGQA